MAIKESAEAEIGWLKILFLTFIAIDVSMIGWLINHYDNGAVGLLDTAVVAVIGLTGVVIAINARAFYLFGLIRRQL